MKRSFISLVIVLCIVAVGPSIDAQPDPAYNGDGSGSGGGPVGGGAPIGGGLVILISLGAGYGLKKVYDVDKRRLDE